jgi:hypothetical protein
VLADIGPSFRCGGRRSGLLPHGTVWSCGRDRPRSSISVPPTRSRAQGPDSSASPLASSSPVPFARRRPACPQRGPGHLTHPSCDGPQRHPGRCPLVAPRVARRHHEPEDSPRGGPPAAIGRASECACEVSGCLHAGGLNRYCAGRVRTVARQTRMRRPNNVFRQVKR